MLCTAAWLIRQQDVIVTARNLALRYEMVQIVERSDHSTEHQQKVVDTVGAVPVVLLSHAVRQVAEM